MSENFNEHENDLEVDENDVEVDVEDLETIILVDEETGENIELVVVDFVETGDEDVTYMLVVEKDEFDNDCPDASIIREFKDGDEYVYEIVEDDEEFEKVSKYFSDFTE